MMFGWLMKRIFVDRRARERIETSREAVSKTAGKPEPVPPATVRLMLDCCHQRSDRC